MLDLPAGRTLYPPETVWVRRVLEPDGTPWRPARGAEVLLLGDSFTNIYSLPSLGWGDAAGLAEQVSYLLRRPVDRIVQNDQGAFATRERFGRALQEDPDRFAGTRVVIYQFAARELAFGDWRVD
jgi:alginate O-acetyltransferase complex protein AlgJ